MLIEYNIHYRFDLNFAVDCNFSSEIQKILFSVLTVRSFKASFKTLIMRQACVLQCTQQSTRPNIVQQRDERK